jgi:hypothetical protein
VVHKLLKINRRGRGRRLLAAPRSDPGERHYRTGLLLWVMGRPVSASTCAVYRGDSRRRHQRWTRTRVISPVAGSRRIRCCSTSHRRVHGRRGRGDPLAPQYTPAATTCPRHSLSMSGHVSPAPRERCCRPGSSAASAMREGSSGSCATSYGRTEHSSASTTRRSGFTAGVPKRALPANQCGAIELRR